MKLPPVTIAIIVICVLVVLFTFLDTRKRVLEINDAKHLQEIDEIRSIIDNAINQDGLGWADLSGVEAVSGYNGDALAKELWRILDSFVQSEEEALTLLAGKTKRQLKTIETSLSRLYGLNLNTYLQQLFKNSLGIIDEQGLKRARTIINNAK